MASGTHVEGVRERVVGGGPPTAIFFLRFSFNASITKSIAGTR